MLLRMLSPLWHPFMLVWQFGPPFPCTPTLSQQPHSAPVDPSGGSSFALGATSSLVWRPYHAPVNPHGGSSFAIRAA